jgi:hypothetical protein
MKRRPNVSSGYSKLSRAKFLPNGVLPKPLHLNRTLKPSASVRLFQSPPSAVNDRLTKNVWRSTKTKTPVRIRTNNKILYSPTAIAVGDTPEKSVCKLRAERRETMFAQGSAGRGYRTRKDNSTRDIKC